ncbi:MAG: hypothetical protein AAB403_05235 [Planctomycetota bacterium]
MVLDSSFISAALEPLRYIPLSQIYDQYSVFIDFLLYLVIFLGVAKWSLESRFPGRAGKALTIGVGTALALSLSLAESSFSFSIKSFGIVAVVVLLLLVGIVLFQLARNVGFSAFMAVLAALVLIYFGIGLLTPSGLDWIDANAPLLHTVAAIALLVLIIKGFFHLFHGAGGISTSPMAAWLTKAETDTATVERQTLESEVPVLAGAGSEIKAAEAEMAALARQTGPDIRTPQTQSYIHSVLRRARDRDMVLRQRLDQVQMLNRKLEAFDLGLFHNLKSHQETLAGPERVRFRKDLDRERIKIYREREVTDLANDAKTQLVRLETVLQVLEDAATKGDSGGARAYALKALRIDKNLDRSMARLQDIERRLMSIIPSASQSKR